MFLKLEDIEHFEYVEDVETVYDLEVDGTSCYFLSLDKDLVLAHNSSKTFSILQILFLKAINEQRCVITVVGQDVPNLKSGAYRDACKIVSESKYLQSWIESNNKSERIFLFKNGSIIEFKSYSNEQDARSGKRDYLFINEANGVEYLVYEQLYIRTKHQTYLDYNPSAPFWVHDNLIGHEGVSLFISDHRHNTFLTKEQHEKIENIPDKDRWRVYARGATGNISGLIFPNWTMIKDEDFPDTDFFGGLDFGYTCFEGNTMITTLNGDTPIKHIKKGDLVLTRNGYKKVLNVFNNGTKKVIEKNIGLDFGYKKIICTFDHNFNVNNQWKKYGLITEKDKLVALSSLTVKSLKDTITESIQTIFTESGKMGANIIKKYYIGKFIKSIMGILQKVWKYTMSILTHSITVLKTLLAYLHLNTLLFTGLCLSTTKQKNQSKTDQKYLLQKIIGKIDGCRYLKTLRTKLEHAKTVLKNTHQQIRTNVFALKNVIINGNTFQKATMCHTNAMRVVKNLWGISTLNQSHVVKNARINFQQVTDVQTIDSYYTEVYDLEVEDCHEYFANGILVHNCDPTCLTKICRVGESIFVKELCYTPGLAPIQIKEIAFANGFGEDTPIYCDHDPEQIAQLRRLGLTAMPARKGQGSVKSGILKLKELKIFYTESSRNLKEELKRYEWIKDKSDGSQTNIPIDKFNHAIDSTRIAVFTQYFR